VCVCVCEGLLLNNFSMSEGDKTSNNSSKNKYKTVVSRRAR